MRNVVSRAAASTATSRAEVLTAQRIAVIFGVFLFFSRASKRAVSTAPTYPKSIFSVEIQSHAFDVDFGAADPRRVGHRVHLVAKKLVRVFAAHAGTKDDFKMVVVA